MSLYAYEWLSIWAYITVKRWCMGKIVEVKRILVIRFRRVGDAVLSTVICSSLRATFPNAKIDYVLNENIASLYEHHPDIDNIVTFNDHENSNIAAYFLKVWRTVRQNHYDVIIDTRSTVRTLLFSLLSPLTRFRIGTWKNYSYFLHNYRINNHLDRLQNMVSSNLMLLQPLNIITPVNYCSDFRLYVSEREREASRNYMVTQGIDFSRPIILAAVTARQAHKVWSKEQMSVVLRKMINEYDAQIIFNFSGASEETYARGLQADMGNDRNIFTRIEAKSLRQLCALIVNCDFFFGNEGGPRHMSQALGVPSYAIYPPGPLKSVWLPDSGSQCHQGISPDDICTSQEQSEMSYQQRFELITVDRVWAGVKPMLEQYLAASSLAD